MATWADQPNNFVQAAATTSVLLGCTEVTFTSTTTYEVALTIGHAGSPGVTCTRTDTGTYQLAFPTASVQFVTIDPSLGETFEQARITALDLDAGTATFQTYLDDAGTSRMSDLNLTSAKFVVRFWGEVLSNA